MSPAANVGHVRALVAACERALDRSAKFTALMIRLNIDERRGERGLRSSTNV
jgi:hypothetical protein